MLLKWLSVLSQSRCPTPSQLAPGRSTLSLSPLKRSQRRETMPKHVEPEP